MCSTWVVLSSKELCVTRPAIPSHKDLNLISLSEMSYSNSTFKLAELDKSKNVH